MQTRQNHPPDLRPHTSTSDLCLSPLRDRRSSCTAAICKVAAEVRSVSLRRHVHNFAIGIVSRGRKSGCFEHEHEHEHRPGHVGIAIQAGRRHKMWSVVSVVLALVGGMNIMHMDWNRGRLYGVRKGDLTGCACQILLHLLLILNLTISYHLIPLLSWPVLLRRWE